MVTLAASSPGKKSQALTEQSPERTPGETGSSKHVTISQLREQRKHKSSYVKNKYTKKDTKINIQR